MSFSQDKPPSYMYQSESIPSYVDGSSSSSSGATAMETEAPPSTPSGVIIRSDGTSVAAGGSGRLAAQLKAQHIRRKQTDLQKKQETVREMQAMVTVRLDDGTVKQVNPTTEEGRAELLKYNGVNVYRALSEEEAKKLPLRVRAALDRFRVPPERALAHFTPQQYRFPPEEDALRSRLLYSDPTNRMQAVSAGLANYLVHTPLLMAMACRKKPLMFHELSHAVYSFYINWMFVLNASMPALSQDEIDSIVEGMGEYFDESIASTGKAPATAPLISPEMAFDQIRVESAEELRALNERGVALYIEREEAVEDAEVIVGDATTFVRLEKIPEGEQLDSLITENIMRDVTEEDLEKWAKQINEANVVLSRGTSHEASNARKEALNNISRFMFTCMLNHGAFPDAWVHSWEATAALREQTDAVCKRYVEHALEQIPELPEEMPQYFLDMFDETSDRSLVRIILAIVGMPPPSDWRAPQFLPEDAEPTDPPDELIAWQRAMEKRVTPPEEVVKAYAEAFNIDFGRLPPGVRAYHLIEAEVKEIPQFAAEWCAARLKTAAVPAPEWFSEWYEGIFGKPLTTRFPSWTTHYIFRGIQTLSAMTFYFSERAFTDTTMSRLTKQVPPFLERGDVDVEMYMGMAHNLSLSMVSLTDTMLRSLEKTVVALLGDSIPLRKTEHFLTKSMMPITEFLTEDAPVDHWNANGKGEDGPDYINLQKTEELRKTQEALVNTMLDQMKGESIVKKVLDIEGSLPPTTGNNPITMTKRGDFVLEALYVVLLENRVDAYNHLIRKGAQQVLLALPQTLQEQTRVKLLAAYDRAVEEHNAKAQIEEGDIVLETVEKTMHLGKRRVVGGGASGKGKKRK